MKRSLRALETLQASLSSTSGNAPGSNAHSLFEGHRLKEATREHQLAKLSPYKRAEYVCLECVAELRDALRDVEEIQYTLSGDTTSTSGGRYGPLLPTSTSREEREESEGEAAGASDVDDERAQLLGGRSHPPSRPRRQPPARRTGEAALLEQELLRARQHARRAHQRLQQLQREAARLAKSSSSVSGGAADTSVEAAVPSSSTAALDALDWQRAERHVEVAKLWYRAVFGISVVSSLATPAASSSLQLNQPAQPRQSVGSMSYFGSGANPLPSGVVATEREVEGGNGSGNGATGRHGADREAPASTGNWNYPSNHDNRDGDGGEALAPPPLQALQLRNAREDAEFQEFFASVQANDELMDAALDRLGGGLARLLDGARGMQDELTVQEHLLQGTSTRIDENEAEIAHMNRRLRRAIQEMNDSSICVYVACLLVLLLVLGVLLRIVK
ncbi:hypothetical protein ABB37_01948 [Leptomonas pyrrhocoris]|uniref:Uncharacterized protein n=1 Tax=Leptomonas pyrrhocoris TaxID=157538 RepID=A0A0N0DY43_LEPPY|nr:hypothetical protein ABB37_01948 [Leptomonas pyrrhocoris]KPA83692.1 hypothetical protein ABB37_01948 [Leptomonas pyrrhocoris]|eukprot:XP_015662131.1 hypothetical protein ABB37_01948 [Leptomonas pyrrhocoris]